MIDLWALPGPAALVGDLVTDLVEGRQLCLAQQMQSTGLRRALEDVLASRQRQLHLVFDDSGQPPRELLLRAVSDGIASPGKLQAGIYWVDGISADRAEVWADAMHEVAESSRNLDPWARALLVILLPEAAVRPRGLDIVERPTSLLSRLDLEVAARYALSEALTIRIKDRIRAELAIQFATPFLPGIRALEILEYWLGAPDDVIASPDRLSYCAEAANQPLSKGGIALALWRAQFTVLMVEMDVERLRLIEQEQLLWQLPNTHPASEGRPEKIVELPEVLELSHLCRQLRWNGRRPDDPIRRRLYLLRDVRNSLSHMDFLSQSEIDGLIAGWESAVT